MFKKALVAALAVVASAAALADAYPSRPITLIVGFPPGGGADAVARTIVKLAELPLGVLTAFIGVPLFLAMLRQFRSKV